MLAAEPVNGEDAGLRDALAGFGLPTDDLGLEGRCFFRFVADGQVVGYGGYEPYGEHALVRSVLVLPEARGRGHGGAMVRFLLDEASPRRRMRCLSAYHLRRGLLLAPGLFGAGPCSRAEGILATKQATLTCATAPLMRLRLSD